MEKSQYLEEIAKAYHGELAGKAFCDMVSEQLPADHARQADLALLGRVEEHTAERLRPLMERHGLPLPDAAEVRAQLAPLAAQITNWDALIGMLRTIVPPSVTDYDALAAAAEEEDRDILDFLAVHERAFLPIVFPKDADEETAGLRAIAQLIEA